MGFIRVLYSVVLDALFPAPQEEAALDALAPESASRELPHALPYDGSVAPLPRRTRSLLAYQDQRVRHLVWLVKYKRDRHAIEIAGYLLWRALASQSAAVQAGQGLRAPTMLIPIPVSDRRRRERGYNQCELLVEEILRLEARQPRARFAGENGLLVRVEHAASQTKKGRAERIESAQGIFAVNEAAAKDLLGKGADIGSIDTTAELVVVDDVITTGSTMKAAVDAIRAAGFENVRGLSLAH